MQFYTERNYKKFYWNNFILMWLIGIALCHTRIIENYEKRLNSIPEEKRPTNDSKHIKLKGKIKRYFCELINFIFKVSMC